MTMLTQPLLDKLSQLRLSGFRAALEEQLHSPHYTQLSFEERLGLLLDDDLQTETVAVPFHYIAEQALNSLNGNGRRGE
jgi:hypothetical protein